MKKWLFLLCFVSLSVLAQEAVADVPVVGPTPWNSALVTLIVTSVLGILSKVVYKLPGKFGDVVRWLVDILSANVEHK